MGQGAELYRSARAQALRRGAQAVRRKDGGGVMRHAREDYQRMQDPAGLIPDDEPVFLIRGQDEFGADTVLDWAGRAENGGADPRLVSLVRGPAPRLREW